MQPDSRCQLVCVEGNISAGKSTLCRSLAEELRYELFLEPVQTNPFIELYYGDPKKYGLPMQMWLLKQRFLAYCLALRQTISSSAPRGVILDRSIFSDVVFADKNRDDGNITAHGYHEYQELRQRLLALVPAPHCVVYLDASPKTCYDRVMSLRKRECESGIPLEYLQGLDTCYKAFVGAMAEIDGVAVRSFNWSPFGQASEVAESVVEARGMAAEAAGWPIQARRQTPVKAAAREKAAAQGGGWEAMVSSDESIVNALRQATTAAAEAVREAEKGDEEGDAAAPAALGGEEEEVKQELSSELEAKAEEELLESFHVLIQQMRSATDIEAAASRNEEGEQQQQQQQQQLSTPARHTTLTSTVAAAAAAAAAGDDDDAAPSTSIAEDGQGVVEELMMKMNAAAAANANAALLTRSSCSSSSSLSSPDSASFDAFASEDESLATDSPLASRHLGKQMDKVALESARQ
eukprot:g1145.t1